MPCLLVHLAAPNLKETIVPCVVVRQSPNFRKFCINDWTSSRTIAAT